MLLISSVLELEMLLQDKNVTIEIDNDAREWLAEHGYDVQMGARPMARLVQEKINVRWPMNYCSVNSVMVAM